MRRLLIVNWYRNFGCLYHGPIRRDNSGAPLRRTLATMRKKAHACVELSQYSALIEGEELPCVGAWES
jgi:hypothetical protein